MIRAQARSTCGLECEGRLVCRAYERRRRKATHPKPANARTANVPPSSLVGVEMAQPPLLVAGVVLMVRRILVGRRVASGGQRRQRPWRTSSSERRHEKITVRRVSYLFWKSLVGVIHPNPRIRSPIINYQCAVCYVKLDVIWGLPSRRPIQK